MHIHEYQAKELLRKFGVATPPGFPCRSADEAAEAARQLGGESWVLKAQIHAGGRGQGGGIKVARTIAEVRRHATHLLGMRLRTQQTGPEGRLVKCLLVEEGADIGRAFYLGLAVDREAQRVALMASGDGGVDIEDVAARSPDRIHKLCIDPATGLRPAEADAIARAIGLPERAIPQARALMQNLYRAFDECDASLAEVNPMALTGDGRVLALDAKFDFDANAFFRHPEIAALRDLDQEDPAEVEAAKFELSYIPLAGNIGCLVNGAGLAMATMDVVRLYGGSPANFLDVNGDASVPRVAEAFRLMLRNPRVAAVLVNLFDGHARCDLMAQALIAAAREAALKVPMVVRLKGTGEREGRALLAQSGLPIVSAGDMADAAELAVAAAKGR